PHHAITAEGVVDQRLELLEATLDEARHPRDGKGTGRELVAGDGPSVDERTQVRLLDSVADAVLEGGDEVGETDRERVSGVDHAPPPSERSKTRFSGRCWWIKSISRVSRTTLAAPGAGCA